MWSARMSDRKVMLVCKPNIFFVVQTQVPLVGPACSFMQPTFQMVTHSYHSVQTYCWLLWKVIVLWPKALWLNCEEIHLNHIFQNPWHVQMQMNRQTVWRKVSGWMNDEEMGRWMSNTEGWMDGGTINRWTYKWMDDQQMDRWMDETEQGRKQAGWINRRTDGWMIDWLADGSIDEQMDELNRRMDEQMAGWTDGSNDEHLDDDWLIDGWMGRWTDRWLSLKDEQKDGWMDYIFFRVPRVKSSTQLTSCWAHQLADVM